MKRYKDTLLIKVSSTNQLPAVYSVTFKNTNTESLDKLIAPENLQINIIDQDSFRLDKGLEKEFDEKVKSIKSDVITLRNGAEGYFIRSSDLDPSKKHPLVVLIHGGPFGNSPKDAFLQLRELLLI